MKNKAEVEKPKEIRDMITLFCGHQIISKRGCSGCILAVNTSSCGMADIARFITKKIDD